MAELFEMRVARPGDEERGWPEANVLLNSPHAPTDIDACRAHIDHTQRTLDGQAIGEAQQINLIIQRVTEEGPQQIVGGAVIAEMETSNASAPWLWKWEGDPGKSDLVLIRYRPPEYPPTLELGGISVHPDYLGRGIGGALSWVRSRVAGHHADDFFPNTGVSPHVLVDCLPVCNRANKVNPFWDNGLVPELRRNGTWEDIVDFCLAEAIAMGINSNHAVIDGDGYDQAKIDWFLGNKTSDVDYDHQDAATWVSWFIGNMMSDAKRNEMISDHFPRRINRDALNGDGVIDSIGSIDPKTVPAMKNVQRNHPDLRPFGFFPTNVGINASVEASTAPRGEGPVSLLCGNVMRKIRATFFQTLNGEGFHGLKDFSAYLAEVDLNDSGLVVPHGLRDQINITEGPVTMYKKF